MATSETFGQTVFTTQQVIDHAYRRMKMPPELISGEKLESALNNLWLILQNYANKGVPVWKIETLLGSLYQNQPAVEYNELGILKVLNANLRTMSRYEALVATTDAGGTPEFAVDGDLETVYTQTGVGSLTLDLGEDVVFDTVGILPNVDGVWNFRFEASIDAVTWNAFKTYTNQSVTRRRWVWHDPHLARVSGYRYVRVRGINLTQLDIEEFYVGKILSAIPLAPLNKDDWFKLPNKVFQGRPTQFWQDLPRGTPILNLWPIPDVANTFSLIESQVHRAVMDVGTMAQQLDIPDRWYDTIVWELAERQADDDPDFKGDIARLERKALEASRVAWSGFEPQGPIYIQPNISRYTRG